MQLYKCPACGYVAEHLTLVHMRTHGCDTRVEFARRYGEPVVIDYTVPAKVKRWAKEMARDSDWNIEATRWHKRWASGQ